MSPDLAGQMGACAPLYLSRGSTECAAFRLGELSCVRLRGVKLSCYHQLRRNELCGQAYERDDKTHC